MNRDRASRDSARSTRGVFAVVGGAVLLSTVVVASGCGFTQEKTSSWIDDADPANYEAAATQIEYPAVDSPVGDDVLSTAPPLSVTDESDINFRYVTLQEAVHTALMNSRVLRDLGGVVLRSPGDIDTTYDVALQELDPRFGVAAALSEFDASFAASAFTEKNDRSLNNQFFGGGTRLLKQDTSTIESQVTKRAATGTQFTFLNHTEYDSNNAPGNAFNSAWTTWLDVEARHPLLRGGGADFLRVAGTSDSPGNLNGVVIARLRTDVSLADFEMSVRDFISNVENSYWDLYFAYRDLDAQLDARDTALATWNRINALYQTGRVGGEAEKEAQAREQYFRFQEAVQNALSGRSGDSTRTNNGSGGGVFRGNGGVMTSERRLRLLMGVSINDGELLRPKDEPPATKVVFDWDSILVESLTRRAELRRQKWIVKQRELELQAMHNFLQPSLDLVGRYRWRGFGHNFFDQDSDERRFNNAVENLLEGDFQEWQLGAEISFPFGNRLAHTAVEHAEVRLTRERVVLSEQEREIVYALSNSVAELNRTWAVLETAEDRRIAAKEQLESVQTAFEADKANFDLLLEAQRRYQDAETNFYRVLLEYTLAIRNVHYEKGSLLDYNEIYLTEDLWPMQAYEEAMQRKANTYDVPDEWRYGLIHHPDPVSSGPYIQNFDSADAAAFEEATSDLVPDTTESEAAPMEDASEGVPAEPMPITPDPAPPAVPAAPAAPQGSAAVIPQPTAEPRVELPVPQQLQPPAVEAEVEQVSYESPADVFMPPATPEAQSGAPRPPKLGGLDE